MNAQPQWLAQRERGSSWLIRTIVGLTLALGRPVGRALLYPICAYFVLFSRRARCASRDYLDRVLSRPPRWRDLLRHHLCFARTILDRSYLLSGRIGYFDCAVEGVESLNTHIASGRGCLLFGAHFGSFDFLRVLGLAESPVPMHLLMHQRNSEKLNALFDALNPGPRTQIIRLGRSQTMLQVAEALARGEIVALLADRVVAGDKMVRCDFLGGEAPLPEGPFVLAAMLRVPVVLFSAVYAGGRRYRIRFEPFAERIVLARASRAAALQAYCQRYATWLEANCKSAPYNWFNFYDFWVR
jgi:predicted LPLAT superfamily acyltransferase